MTLYFIFVILFSLHYSIFGEVLHKLFNSYDLLLKLQRALETVKIIKEYVSSDGETIYSNVFYTSHIRRRFLNFIHLKNITNIKFDFIELYEE